MKFYAEVTYTVKQELDVEADSIEEARTKLETEGVDPDDFVTRSQSLPVVTHLDYADDEAWDDGEES